MEKEKRIFGWGYMYPYHVRIKEGVIEAQAAGFDSEYARLRGENAVKELKKLENSSGDKYFANEKDIIEFLEQ